MFLEMSLEKKKSKDDQMNTVRDFKPHRKKNTSKAATITVLKLSMIFQKRTWCDFKISLSTPIHYLILKPTRLFTCKKNTFFIYALTLNL